MTTTHKLDVMCTDSTACDCPVISGDKACFIVHLLNEFVGATNPVTIELEGEDFTMLVCYITVATLRNYKGGE